MAVVSSIPTYQAPVTPLRTADRTFRPDVEGLRAVAVALVILAHAGVGLLAGGFIGVDVFFVLSGFLITGLLLKEYESHGRISITNFYARRIRRILPASTLVLVASVIGSYLFLGTNSASHIANDAQWSTLFASNLRFIQESVNYLDSQVPPSPLQHFWSLAVEEQFYAVWPLSFILIALVATRISLRAKMSAVLTIGIVASLSWSIVQTYHNGAVAYFSPFTRAWELATGALLAVATPALLSLPRRVGIVMSLLGVAMIAVSALLFNDLTPFPGYAVILPVVGAALAVAGGTSAPGGGAEALLSLRPFQWLGKLSYSLYLWHWPVLIIAKEHAGGDVSLGATILLILLAVTFTVVTFLLVENPVRNSTWLKRRSPWITVAVGACLIIVSLGIATGGIAWFGPHPPPQQLAPVVVFPGN